MTSKSAAVNIDMKKSKGDYLSKPKKLHFLTGLIIIAPRKMIVCTGKIVRNTVIFGKIMQRQKKDKKGYIEEKLNTNIKYFEFFKFFKFF